MKIIYVKFSKDIEPIIELDEYDKFWLKEMVGDNFSDETGEVEINFYKEKDYYLPIFDKNKEPDYIGVFSIEEIKDIIENSKKRNKKYYVEVKYQQNS